MVDLLPLARGYSRCGMPTSHASKTDYVALPLMEACSWPLQAGLYRNLPKAMSFIYSVKNAHTIITPHW
jgi:hypothetical protein